MRGRLIVDVSSLLRWTGAAVGIARVEHALAAAALERADAMVACYDGTAFRSLDPRWRDQLLGWSGALDTHRPVRRTGWRALLPTRQPVVAALERRRLTSGPVAAAISAGAQRVLLAVRPHRFPLFDAQRRRIANVPPDLALGEDLRPAAGDTVLAAGAHWSDRDPAAINAARARDGFRYVALCYDIIPVTHPQFYQRDVARRFREYWRTMLPDADAVIVNAGCIADDLRRFCAAEALPPPPIVARPLGYDPPVPGGRAALPAGLRPGRYALFVSTIEPRKGHAMLLRVWRRLLARGLPQRAGFGLVFVGRPGWMVEPVLAEIASGAGLEGTVRHLDGIGDAVLGALYEGAAFGIYPSAYEGFGLPVIECLAHGRPVLASCGGALRETMAGLLPCLDPSDEPAWETALEDWIGRPDAVADAAARVRDGFAAPTWPAAAAAILAAAV